MMSRHVHWRMVEVDNSRSFTLGNCRSRHGTGEWNLNSPTPPDPRLTNCTMYSIYNEPPSTPSRSSRSVTTQTPSRSQPSSTILPPAASRSSTTIPHAGVGSGLGDMGNGNPTLITHTTMSQEYASLRYPGHCPLGMYLIPDKDNIFVWDGVFFVHQGSSSAHFPSVLCDNRKLRYPLSSHPLLSTYTYDVLVLRHI